MERESQRWLESLENSLQKLPESVRGITVADREAASLDEWLYNPHSARQEVAKRATNGGSSELTHSEARNPAPIQVL